MCPTDDMSADDSESRAESSASASRPLAGVRVLDLSTTFSGPYCTLLLAQLGAEVIKVEAPAGDISRTRGTARNDAMASVFMTLNAGKRSVAVDLKTAGGQQIFRRLCSGADVLVHNMRAAAAARIGADYATVSAYNPRIVHVAISGFGSNGPYAGAPAYDDIIQALSGLADLQGHLNATQEPTYVASAVADKVGGMSAALTTLAGLYRRTQEGVGSQIEVPMFEVATGFSLLEHLAGHMFHPPLGPPGYIRMLTPHRRPYKTADGYLAVMPYTGRHWNSLLSHIGRPELLSDPRFCNDQKRADNSAELYALLEAALVNRPTAEWYHDLQALDVPVMPVNTLESVFEDPHLTEVDFFRRQQHPTEGETIQMRPGFTFEGDVLAAPLSPAEQIGSSTDQVLNEIGFSGEEVEDFRASASVFGPKDKA